MSGFLGDRRDWIRPRQQLHQGVSEKDVADAGDDEIVPIVVYVPVRCPFCESKEHRCYKTDLPIRYHRCSLCKKRFKSVEQSKNL